MESSARASGEVDQQTQRQKYAHKVFSPKNVIKINKTSYEVEQILQYGDFGDLYRVKCNGKKFHLVTELQNAPSACSNMLKAGELLIEKSLLPMEKKKHFPCTENMGTDKLFKYLVYRCIGPPIPDIRRYIIKANFIPREAMNLTIQTYFLIETMHNLGFVHGSICPAAFSLGLQKDEMTVILNSFGRVKRFRGKDGTLRKKKKTAVFYGSLIFCSRDTHRKHDYGTRDDMECWFYTICDIFDDGNPPWKPKNKCRQPPEEAILAKKEALFQGKHAGFESIPNCLWNLLPLIERGGDELEYAAYRKIVSDCVNSMKTSQGCLSTASWIGYSELIEAQIPKPKRPKPSEYTGADVDEIRSAENQSKSNSRKKHGGSKRKRAANNKKDKKNSDDSDERKKSSEEEDDAKRGVPRTMANTTLKKKDKEKEKKPTPEEIVDGSDERDDDVGGKKACPAKGGRPIVKPTVVKKEKEVDKKRSNEDMVDGSDERDDHGSAKKSDSIRPNKGKQKKKNEQRRRGSDENEEGKRKKGSDEKNNDSDKKKRGSDEYDRDRDKEDGQGGGAEKQADSDEDDTKRKRKGKCRVGIIPSPDPIVNEKVEKRSGAVPRERRTGNKEVKDENKGSGSSMLGVKPLTHLSKDSAHEREMGYLQPPSNGSKSKLNRIKNAVGEPLERNRPARDRDDESP